jgi:hypothetical protein
MTDLYGAPRRRSDAGGPLIRWTVMLALGGGCVAFAQHVMSAEQNRAETVRLREAASTPQFTPTAMERDGSEDPGAPAAEETTGGDGAEPVEPPELAAPEREAFLGPLPAREQRTPASAANFPIASPVDSERIPSSADDSSFGDSGAEPAGAAGSPPPT